jgi:hypothetical protein
MNDVEISDVWVKACETQSTDFTQANVPDLLGLAQWPEVVIIADELPGVSITTNSNPHEESSSTVRALS